MAWMDRVESTNELSSAKTRLFAHQLLTCHYLTTSYSTTGYSTSSYSTSS